MHIKSMGRGTAGVQAPEGGQGQKSGSGSGHAENNRHTTTLASTPQGVAGNHRQGAKGVSTTGCHRRGCRERSAENRKRWKKVVQTAVKTAIEGVMARAAERRRQEHVRANAQKEENRRRDIGAAGALHTRQMAAAKRGRGRVPDGDDEFRPQTRRPTHSHQHVDGVGPY